MLAWVTGRIEDSLRQKLAFVLEENRVYRALLERHSPHWRLQDSERKALAEKGRPLRKLLAHVITIAQPETLLKWHLWLVKTPSRRKQMQSIDAERDVREGGSDPAHKE